MRQLAEIHTDLGYEPDLEPVSAFEGLMLASGAINAHEEQLAALYGPEAVRRAQDSIRFHVEALGSEDMMRPHTEQTNVSTMRFSPAVQKVVFKGLHYAVEDGAANTVPDSESDRPQDASARRAQQKLASMVLHQFAEGDRDIDGKSAAMFRAGKHRRPEGAPRPAASPRAHRGPQHARRPVSPRTNQLSHNTPATPETPHFRGRGLGKSLRRLRPVVLGRRVRS